jgi:hypothetical protein
VVKVITETRLNQLRTKVHQDEIGCEVVARENMYHSQISNNVESLDDDGERNE